MYILAEEFRILDGVFSSTHLSVLAPDLKPFFSVVHFDECICLQHL